MKIVLFVLALAAIVFTLPNLALAASTTTTTTTTTSTSDQSSTQSLPQGYSVPQPYQPTYQAYPTVQPVQAAKAKPQQHRRHGNFLTRLFYAGVAKYLLKIPVTAALAL